MSAAVTIRPAKPQPPQVDAADEFDDDYSQVLKIFGAPEPVTIRHPE